MAGLVDISLVWYVASEETLSGGRVDVRALAVELDLPVGQQYRGPTARAFIATCERTKHAYGDPERRRWQVVAQRGHQTPELVSMTLLRVPDEGEPDEGGTPLKLAEVKMFRPRRTARGVVMDSQRVKYMIRRTLPAADHAATQAWIDRFLAHYEALMQEAPASAARRIARESLLRAHAIPVLNKPGLYFMYAQDLPAAERVREFLARVQACGDLVAMPVAAGPSQLATIAEAADELMLEELRNLQRLIDRWIAGAQEAHYVNNVPVYRRDQARMVARIELHEERLHRSLPLSRSVLPYLDSRLDEAEAGLKLTDRRSAQLRSAGRR